MPGWITFAEMKQFAVEFGINATVSGLNTAGSLACIVSGASFAVASSSEDALSISYFGASDTRGTFDFYFQLNDSSVQLNTSVPYTHYEEIDGDDGLSNYINPAKLSIFGLVVGTTGTLLKAAASNIRTWKQGRDDAVQFVTEYKKAIKPPEKIEYHDAMTAAVLSSLSTICLSNTVVGTFIQLSGSTGTNYSITYPAKGEISAKHSKYKGPLRLEVIPLDLGPNFELPSNKSNVNYSIVFGTVFDSNATANVTYGGGLFFNTQKANPYPVPLPALAGMGLFVASGFFSRKAERARVKRMLEAKEGYLLMP